MHYSKRAPALFTALTIAFSLLSSRVLAQSSTPITITVTPARVDKPLEDIPAAVSVVGQQEIQGGREQLGLDEPLKQMPGVFFLNRYNFAQDLRASIRGFGARANFGIRGIKIIVDGIPETLADGQGSVDGIDIGSARRISVIRGPASSLYGNASGGAILIESERGGVKPFAEFRLTAGDYGYTRPQLKLGGGSNTASYLMNLSDTRIAGYRDHSEFKNTQFNGRFDFDVSRDSSLLFSLHHTDQPMANDPGGITAAEVAANPKQARDRNVQFNAGEALQQTRLGALYKSRLSDTLNIETRFYRTERDFNNRLPFQVGGAVDLRRRFSGAGVKLVQRANVFGMKNRLMLGADLDRQDDDRQRFDNLNGVPGAQTLSQNETVTSLGVFVQNEIELGEQIELTLGLRHDDISFDVSDAFLADGNDSGEVSLDHASPMLGLMYKYDAQTRYYATISTAFETATTTEFANPNGGGFNRSLEPQKSINYEVGYRRTGENYRAELAVFHIVIDDELTPFELPSQPGRSFFDNAGSSSRNGVEISLRNALGQGFELTTAYTYSDFVFDRFSDGSGNVFDGMRTPGIPEHLLQLDIAWESGYGLFASVNNSYTGELFVDNSNNTRVGASAVSDMRIGYRGLQKRLSLEVFAGINNLTDEKYNNNIRINAFGGRFYEPAPERNLIGGVTVRGSF